MLISWQHNRRILKNGHFSWTVCKYVNLSLVSCSVSKLCNICAATQLHLSLFLCVKAIHTTHFKATNGTVYRMSRYYKLNCYRSMFLQSITCVLVSMNRLITKSILFFAVIWVKHLESIECINPLDTNIWHQNSTHKLVCHGNCHMW